MRWRWRLRSYRKIKERKSVTKQKQRNKQAVEAKPMPSFSAKLGYVAKKLHVRQENTSDDDTLKVQKGF